MHYNGDSASANSDPGLDYEDAFYNGNDNTIRSLVFHQACHY